MDEPLVKNAVTCTICQSPAYAGKYRASKGMDAVVGTDRLPSSRGHSYNWILSDFIGIVEDED